MFRRREWGVWVILVAMAWFVNAVSTLEGVEAPRPAPGTSASDSDASALDKLAPHAAGVALVEIVEPDGDDRPQADGQNGPRQLLFKIHRRTGTTRDGLALAGSAQTAEAADGVEGAGNEAAAVELPTFRSGRKYWVAFASRYQSDRYPHGIIAAWPDGKQPKPITQAVEQNQLADHPQFDPKTGLTHTVLKLDHGVRVRLHKRQELLWTTRLPDETSDGGFRPEYTRLTPSAAWASLIAPRRIDAGTYLVVKAQGNLPEANRFHVPPMNDSHAQFGGYTLDYIVCARDGRLVAVQVIRPAVQWSGPTPPPEGFSMVCLIDPKTGKVTHDIRDQGGRRTVRVYDPQTGRRTRSEVYRWLGAAEDGRWMLIRYTR